jgi:hypothetical protein
MQPEPVPVTVPMYPCPWANITRAHLTADTQEVDSMVELELYS